MIRPNGLPDWHLGLTTPIDLPDTTALPEQEEPHEPVPWDDLVTGGQRRRRDRTLLDDIAGAVAAYVVLLAVLALTAAIIAYTLGKG